MLQENAYNQIETAILIWFKILVNVGGNPSFNGNI